MTVKVKVKSKELNIGGRETYMNINAKRLGMELVWLLVWDLGLSHLESRQGELLLVAGK